MTHESVVGANLPDMAHPNHGRTLAAWVTTVGISVAALIAAISIGTAIWAWVWVGSIIAVVALVAGAALKALGHGQPRR
jgi:fatty acid desaturase